MNRCKEQFAALLLFLIPSFLFSQDKKTVDDLLSRLEKSGQDTVRCNLLYEVAQEYQNKSDNTNARMYAERNLVLSEKLSYEKGIANSFHVLGNAAVSSGNYDSANYFLKEAIVIRQKLGDKNGITASLYAMGQLNRTRGEYDSSLIWYNKALMLAHQISDSFMLAKINMGLGVVHYNLGNYSPALEYYLKTLRIAENLGDRKQMARVMGNIGLVYSFLGKQEEAIRYHHQSIELKKELNDTKGIAYSFENLGTVYVQKQQYDSALYFFRQSIPMGEKIGDKKLEGILYSDMSLAFAQLSQADSALIYNEKGYDLRKQIHDKDGMVHSMMNKGEILMSLAKERKDNTYYEKAIAAFEVALKDAEDIGRQEWKLNLYQWLSQSHAAMNRFHRAYHYQKLYSGFSDSIKSEAFTRQIAEMQEKYESEKKDKEITMLNAEKEISDAKISRQRILNYGLAGITFLIVVSAYLVYRNIQHKRKAEAQYAMLEKQHAVETMRSKISIDIHDDLGSGLTKIGLLTQQIQDKKDSPQAFADLMNKIQLLSKEVVTGLREVIWASNPANDNLTSLLSFLRGYIQRFFEGTSFNYTVNFPDEVPEMNIHPEVKRNLFLTLKESLNNMAKHSGASEVNIMFMNKGEKFSFEISDNGKGINEQVLNAMGNGLRNMKKRMEDIKAEFKLISSPGSGVKVHITGMLY